MAHDLVTTFPTAKRVLEEVDDALGYKLSTIMFDGPQVPAFLDRIVLT
jgi:hypothetical protein